MAKRSSTRTRAFQAIVLSLLLAACASRIDESPASEAAPRQPDECKPDSAAGGLALTCPRLSRCDPDAPTPARIRVATWNIKAGAASNLAEIVDVLRELDADIVLLQEVDREVDRSGRVDQARAIARSLTQRYVFAPTLELEGGTYGIAVLSRLPFEHVRRIPLTNDEAAEIRTALEVQLCVGPSAWRVIDHHADYRAAAARRSVVEVVTALDDRPELPTLFGGDFNQLPNDVGPLACASADLVDIVAEFDPSPTFGASRLDYVFADAALADQTADAQVVSTSASDHLPLLVEFSL